MIKIQIKLALQFVPLDSVTPSPRGGFTSLQCNLYFYVDSWHLLEEQVLSKGLTKLNLNLNSYTHYLHL